MTIIEFAGHQVKRFCLDVRVYFSLTCAARIMAKQIITIFIAVALLSTAVAFGQESGRFDIATTDLSPKAVSQYLTKRDRDFRIGLALSGGGARGFAHIGVLRALEEAGIDIDIVAGTSMGGIIGGLYAAGLTPAQIETQALAIEWNTFFSDSPRRTSQLFTRRAETEGALIVARFDGFNPQIPTALSRGQKLVNVLSELSQATSYFSGGDFANLDRRLAIVSTDLVTGKKVTFTSGSLVEALRATMGVPLAFTPLERDGQLLMDGGLLEPIPTETARSIGADFVIAVDASSVLLDKEEINTPIDIANQTTTIMSERVRAELLRKADVAIIPDLDGIGSIDFGDGDEAIRKGYEITSASIPEIRRLLSQRSMQSDSVRIDSVEFADEQSRKLCNLENSEMLEHKGKLLPRGQLGEVAYDLFRTGLYSSLEYEYDSANSAVLRLKLSPFPIISEINFEGNRVHSDSVLKAILIAESHPIKSLRELKTFYDRLITYYRSEGYDLAQIKGAWLDDKTGVLTIIIDEGQIVGISVEGVVKTRGWVVTSYFPLSVGDFYNKNRASRGIQEIYSSGLYENVNMRLEERSGGVHITLVVKENIFTFARLGARYHEVFHPEAFMRLGYSNLFGTGHELSSYLKFSERRKLYQLQLRADRIFRTFVTYRVQTYYANDKIGMFTEDVETSLRTVKRWGVKIGVGQQLMKLGLVEVLARYEQIRYDNPPVGPVIERRLASLIGSLRYDTKDRYAFATRGAAVELSVEAASDILGADDVIRKFQGSIEVYRQFARKFTLHPRGGLGLSQSELPVYERFYLGGSRTFFGYQTDQLSGDKYLLGNLELRIGPIYSFYLSGRYDVGDVFGSLEEIRFDNLRHGYGISLSLDSFFGPVSFGYGRTERGYDQLYLNIGYDF